MAKQITFGVSVPTKAYVDIIDEIARKQNRSRSQQICKMILDEAQKHAIDIKQLRLAK